MIRLKRGTSIEGVTLKDGQPIAILSDNNSASLYIGDQSGTPVKVSSDSSLSSIYTDEGITPNQGTFNIGRPWSDIGLSGYNVTLNAASNLQLLSSTGTLSLSSSYMTLHSNDMINISSLSGVSIETPRIDLPSSSYAGGERIVTSSSILDTGLKLIGVGTIYKSATPYYQDPPEGTYIQNDNIVTFNDPAFLYDEGQSQYSQKHSYTSFVGYDHLVWDTTKNLYQFDPGPSTYEIKAVKITAYLSGGLIPYTDEVAAGIWYGPYCSQGTDVTSWVDVGEPNGKTFLDADYISLSGSRFHYFGSTYSVIHKINSSLASSGYYPNIGFSTYTDCKFVPGMGGCSCKMVIELYASQSGLIQ